MLSGYALFVHISHETHWYTAEFFNQLLVSNQHRVFIKLEIRKISLYEFAYELHNIYPIEYNIDYTVIAFPFKLECNHGLFYVQKKSPIIRVQLIMNVLTIKALP